MLPRPTSIFSERPAYDTGMYAEPRPWVPSRPPPEKAAFYSTLPVQYMVGSVSVNSRQDAPAPKFTILAGPDHFSICGAVSRQEYNFPSSANQRAGLLLTRIQIPAGCVEDGDSVQIAFGEGVIKLSGKEFNELRPDEMLANVAVSSYESVLCAFSPDGTRRTIRKSEGQAAYVGSAVPPRADCTPHAVRDFLGKLSHETRKAVEAEIAEPEAKRADAVNIQSGASEDIERAVSLWRRSRKDAQNAEEARVAIVCANDAINGEVGATKIGGEKFIGEFLGVESLAPEHVAAVKEDAKRRIEAVKRDDIESVRRGAALKGERFVAAFVKALDAFLAPSETPRMRELGLEIPEDVRVYARKLKEALVF